MAIEPKTSYKKRSFESRDTYTASIRPRSSAPGCTRSQAISPRTNFAIGHEARLVLFQRLTNNWDDDHRPLQFQDFSLRPDDLYRKRYLRRLVEDTVETYPSTTAWSSASRELEGKSYEEISEITGVNLGTVKSRLHRARNSFAQRIEPFLN